MTEQKKENQIQPLNQEEKPKKVKKYKEHSRATDLFTPDFIEELFMQWINGKTLADIHKSYIGTPKQFSIQALNNIKVKKKWDKRKEHVEASLAKETEHQIVIANRKKVKVINDLFLTTLDTLKKKLDKYNDSPDSYDNLPEDKKPMWMAETLYQLEKIILLHDNVVNKINPNAVEPVNPNSTTVNIIKDLNILPQEIQSLFLKAMAKSKKEVEADFKEITDGNK